MTAGLINEKKLMNVEHRTSNIEHRIMYSVHFKSTERSESIIRQSTFDIRHFMKFHKSGRLRLMASRSDQKRNCCGSIPKSTVVGFRISWWRRKNVGWVECNETQQSPELRTGEGRSWKNAFLVRCQYKMHNFMTVICRDRKVSRSRCLLPSFSRPSIDAYRIPLSMASINVWVWSSRREKPLSWRNRICRFRSTTM